MALPHAVTASATHGVLHEAQPAQCALVEEWASSATSAASVAVRWPSCVLWKHAKSCQMHDAGVLVAAMVVVVVVVPAPSRAMQHIVELPVHGQALHELPLELDVRLLGRARPGAILARRQLLVAAAKGVDECVLLVHLLAALADVLHDLVLAGVVVGEGREAVREPRLAAVQRQGADGRPQLRLRPHLVREHPGPARLLFCPWTGPSLLPVVVPHDLVQPLVLRINLATPERPLVRQHDPRLLQNVHVEGHRVALRQARDLALAPGLGPLLDVEELPGLALEEDGRPSVEGRAPSLRCPFPRRRVVHEARAVGVLLAPLLHPLHVAERVLIVGHGL
mmetsp:Transcript_53710/g.153065  ORF Transcript_53710/g.153065 Transcript_53710/m.153065 type:complete len:337 (-) Transcript_53710:404-1414(-)